MKATLLSLLALWIAILAPAQSTSKTLKKTLDLKMSKTAEDDMSGTRGAAVVWHPVQKKYYAVFAGNYEYPLSVFDSKGKRLSATDQAALFDIRGMWYNQVTKTLQMNGYSENGWAEYKLDAKGIPADVEMLYEGMNQPDAQSTGLYNAREKAVSFFNNDGKLYKYDLASGSPVSSVTLSLGKVSENDEFENEDVIKGYNLSAVYTDIPGSEIALLNQYERKIELYSLRTGFKVKEFNLPEDAPAEALFNFAFANGTYWLFDMKARTWKGYN
jgi:hypothetical protein